MTATCSLSEARALLGLTGPADPETCKAAFRTAIKAARPDAPGGDPDRFRQIISAWHMIRSLEPAPLALPAPRRVPRPVAVVSLSVREALSGTTRRVRLGKGRIVDVRIPAGVRAGDHIRLAAAGDGGADIFLPVLIRSEGDMAVQGADLYMDWPVDARVLRHGGRVSVATHAGEHSLWITADQQSRLMRIKGLGLPARGRRAAGHLFVRLIETESCPSASADLLHRFRSVWTRPAEAA
ncbi:MAG: DnaJ C-terminal domain-containing protein [Brevundimonas sp.]|jgi:curved DNA-binding protein|uniref:DnaJ C-terminal domain-containing protein n=1 Tax=Brevundimonas sp. TaxID=1871086 RepID=UPI003918A039